MCSKAARFCAVLCNAELGGMWLKKLAKFFNGEASVTNDSAKRKRVDRVVTRNRQNAPAI